MDPSEFEGTVTRIRDPLGAFGGLEELLTVQNPKFVHLDLSKESDQICITIFKIKESLQKWNEVSFNNLRLAWDEQAIKIAEYKEEVATRKKLLGAKIRRFGSLRSATDEGSATDVEEESKELISSFKTEFDFLANTSKFSEGAFLSTYKLLRDTPDPSEELGDCLKICARAQETLANAQEQLNIAEKTVEESNSANIQSGGTISTALTDELMASKYESHVQALEEKFSADLTAMRDKIEAETRSREHSLRSALERQQLELQQQSEDSLARKDSELSSLMNSLNALNQRSLEDEERKGMLDCEIQKRRELEERLRSSLTELGSAQSLNHELQAKCESLTTKAHTSDALIAKSDKQLKELTTSGQSQLRLLTEKLEAAENELLSRPPADLSALAQSVGMVGGALSDDTFDQIDRNQDPAGPKKRYMSWSKIETIVIDCIRRSSLEATESRVREQDAIKSLQLTKADCDRLQLTLLEREKVVTGLERDLLAAHNSVHDSNALMKCYNKGNKVDKSAGEEISQHGDVDVGLPISLNFSQAAEDARGWDSVKSLGSILADVDIEKGSGGRGVAGVVLGESKGDRMMAAVQGQRDRFMKIAHAKEAEVTSLRSRLDGALEEQKQLCSENLELFQRLRLLRASSRRPADGGSRDIEEEGGWKATIAGKSRNRRDVKGPSMSYGGDGEDDGLKRTDGDALDRKYMHLYEEKIDPFKLEELDRMNVLSRMNILERGLAYLTRFFLHDQWARHALMVYLFLVHGFALCYVLQVLNPQLIEEVDTVMKAKWSAQTLDLAEHPDVRFRRY
jgi:hypothetical protein